MLKPQRRLTKRKLKEDKLVTIYFKTVDFVRENQNRLLGAVTAIFVIILIIFWSSKISSSKETRAANALARAEIKMNEGQYNAAIDSLQLLIDSEDGAKSTGIGVFYLANLYFQNENFELAQTYYEKYLDDYQDNETFSSSALAGIGSCLEGQGEYKKAAEMDEKAVEKYSNIFDNANKLMNAARCYVLAGNKEKARAIYKRIIEEYPNSGYKNDAEISLAQIDA